MSQRKSNIERLADSIIRDALKRETPLEVRIAALRAVTALHLGEERNDLHRRSKGLPDEDRSAPTTDFAALRQRVHAVNE